MAENSHIPVLLNEVLEGLSPKDGEVYLDCTFGAGGYSQAILNSCDCKLYAIDQDPNVKIHADKLKEQFKERFNFLSGKFADMQSLLKNVNIDKIDGIVMDIGVSSMQIDEAERGFSFAKKGPLDMRMSKEGVSAEDFVNNYSEENIANVIYNYGGERRSRRVAAAIVKEREESPITTTDRLASIVRSVVPKGNSKIDSATRTFQAIRIWVNDELEQLKKSLEASEKILDKNGRLVVVTFHSLEDSIVKEFMREKSGKNKSVSRHMPVTEDETTKIFDIKKSKAVKPTDAEIKMNVRARSAKLRVAIKR